MESGKIRAGDLFEGERRKLLVTNTCIPHHSQSVSVTEFREGHGFRIIEMAKDELYAIPFKCNVFGI